MRPDEWAKEAEIWRARASSARNAAVCALHRLLKIAEESDTGQSRRVVQFLASCYDGGAYSFDLVDLRAVDVQISDDMLVCLGKV